jgi:hypothetical protein
MGQAAVSGVQWNILNFSSVCWCYFLNIAMLWLIDVTEKTWLSSIIVMVKGDEVLQHGGNECVKFVEVIFHYSGLFNFVYYNKCKNNGRYSYRA